MSDINPTSMAVEAYKVECEKLCIPIIPTITKVLEEQPEVLDFTRTYVGDK